MASRNVQFIPTVTFVHWKKIIISVSGLGLHMKGTKMTKV